MHLDSEARDTAQHRRTPRASRPAKRRPEEVCPDRNRGAPAGVAVVAVSARKRRSPRRPMRWRQARRSVRARAQSRSPPLRRPVERSMQWVGRPRVGGPHTPSQTRPVPQGGGDRAGSISRAGAGPCGDDREKLALQIGSGALRASFHDTGRLGTANREERARHHDE